jgi:hypothetical protein
MRKEREKKAKKSLTKGDVRHKDRGQSGSILELLQLLELLELLLAAIYSCQLASIRAQPKNYYQYGRAFFISKLNKGRFALRARAWTRDFGST